MREILQNSSILLIFAVAALGYILGNIKLKGMSLGTAGALVVALIFGHFGLTAPGIVQDLGLCCFATAVGFIAGHGFFRSFTGNAVAYAVLGIIIIAAAMTTTPGLVAALEATGSDLVSLGYGIAYPFGVMMEKVMLPLPDGTGFSLGTSGGPLIAGLLATSGA